MMCRIPGVSPSSYYAWNHRPPSQRRSEDEKLSLMIKEWHARSRGTYGSPRILEDLRERGHRVGCKRVARLMRAAGLRGVSRRKWITTTIRDVLVRPAEDLAYRKFVAMAPDQLWVADITQIPTWTGTLYLAAVLDMFSRRVVGWPMAVHMRTELVLDAPDMALGRRRPVNVVHHSDHGSQYTSIAFGNRCGRPACDPRWDRLATPLTTPLPRASSPPWSASCSFALGSALKPRPAWTSSTSSKVSTTLTAATPVSGKSHPWSSRESMLLSLGFKPLARPRNRDNSMVTPPA